MPIDGDPRRAIADPRDVAETSLALAQLRRMHREVHPAREPERTGRAALLAIAVGAGVAAILVSPAAVSLAAAAWLAVELRKK